MGRISISETIKAPVETVFAYVDDHRNTTRYMHGLTRWHPTTDVTHGKGATFEVTMKAGPTNLTSVVDITAWQENRTIGWRSVSGFKQSGRWSFKTKGEGTEATLEMDYELPGGIAGRMLSRAAEPVVRGNLQKSVATLKQHAERLRPKASGGGTRATAAPAKAAARTPASAARKPAAKPGARSAAKRGGSRGSRS